jgi:hypothetical protein
MSAITRLTAALASIGVTFAIVLGVVSVAEYERTAALASALPVPLQIVAAAASGTVR